MKLFTLEHGPLDHKLDFSPPGAGVTTSLWDHLLNRAMKPAWFVPRGTGHRPDNSEGSRP